MSPVTKIHRDHGMVPLMVLEENQRKCAISSGHCLKLTIIFKSIKITNILQEKISTIDQIPFFAVQMRI